MITQRKRSKAPLVIRRRALVLAVLALLLVTAAVPTASATPLRLGPVADTYVDSGHPTMPHGGEPGLWAGYDQAGGYLIERALIAFDPSAIPGWKHNNISDTRVVPRGNDHQ